MQPTKSSEVTVQPGGDAAEPQAEHQPATVQVAGHEMTLFAESPPLIEAMVADIRSARARVWMESYILANDAAGQAVIAAMVDRAKAGVEVRLMVDALGSFSSPNSLFAPLLAAGGQVHFFHALGQTLRGPRFLQTFNQRNHRKLLIVDDTIAYFGGMNVVDQRGIHSTADAKARQLPASAGWRDVHVRLVGPRQHELAATFDWLWRRVHHLPNEKRPPWPVKEMLRARQDAIFFFDSRPAFKRRRPQRVFVPLIRQADREITLCMAYFLPTGSVLRELIRARRRGVRVRVIVPEQSDVKLVQWATRHYYEYLLKRGIRIYERQDRMLHSKAMVIDGRWSVIGSCNLDPRSLLLNLEFFAAIYSKEMATSLNQICRDEMRESVPVRAADVRARHCGQRFRDRVAWAFRKWL